MATYAFQREEMEDVQVTENDPGFLRREAERMLKRAEILESLPSDDPFEPGTVLTFSKQLGGEYYQYATLKQKWGQGYGWYVTATRHNSGPYHWNSLIDFIGVENCVSILVVDTTKSVKLTDYVKGVTKILDSGDITLEDSNQTERPK